MELKVCIYLLTMTRFHWQRKSKQYTNSSSFIELKSFHFFGFGFVWIDVEWKNVVKNNYLLILKINIIEVFVIVVHNFRRGCIMYICLLLAERKSLILNNGSIGKKCTAIFGQLLLIIVFQFFSSLRLLFRDTFKTISVEMEKKCR